MPRGPGIAILFAGMLLMAAPFPAAAAAWESLVMPGPVIGGHAKFEQECTRCHAPFSKKGQSQLCLACHEDLAHDVEGDTGFHGRSPAVEKVDCKHCHSEHRGRFFDALPLDPDTFDHALTDFPLRGGHAKARCDSCHLPDKKHRLAPGDCKGCHGADDPHRGRLGETCNDCHQETSWTSASFDHDKTGFSLRDRHAKAACAACHPAARYKDTPKRCLACHRTDDTHAGLFGEDCNSCHRTAGWKPPRFDHDRDTKFRLTGGHRDATCKACHPGHLFREKTSTACAACHRDDDEHHGRNGTDCASCHQTGTWAKVRFDHNRDTKYRLEGAHRKLICRACHRDAAERAKPGKICVDCHRADDVHTGLNGTNCAECHGQIRWKPATFDHARATRFPLRFSHAKVPCAGCHREPVHAGKTRTDCFACHGGQDVHGGKQGRACHRCHSEEGWGKRVFFEHDLTRFPLIGQHAVVPCEECHLTPAYRDTASDCQACHHTDDVHEKRLGTACAQCHNPNGWSLWIFDHDTRTDFRLDSAHAGIACRACHREPMAPEASLPKSCFACHRGDDTHRGAFGRDCAHCHKTTSFSDLRGMR